MQTRVGDLRGREFNRERKSVKMEHKTERNGLKGRGIRK